MLARSRLRRSAILPAFLVSLAPALAWARSGGLASIGCDGCHGGVQETKITLTSEPERFEPGTLVRFRVTVEHRGLVVAGVYVPIPDVGQLRAVAGEGLTLTGDGLLHSMPKAGTNEAASFQFEWQAPTTPGALHLEAYGLAANDDRRTSGDTAGFAKYARAFGCEPQTFYFDADRDGFGALDSPSTEGCAGEPPEAYSATSDDCDDVYEFVFPGAPERCNDRDDNCNQMVDEGAVPMELWPDDDGDGYAGYSTASVIGCLPLDGYALERNDCDDRSPERHPNAEEVCNLIDDDCDGRADERVRPQCGQGWCVRESPTCSAEDCVPGSPTSETCNLLDDDCDGQIDEDSCGANGQCVAGVCMLATPPPATPPPTTPAPTATPTGSAPSPAPTAPPSTTPSASPAPGPTSSPNPPAVSPAPPSAKSSGCSFSVPSPLSALSALLPALLVLLVFRRRASS